MPEYIVRNGFNVLHANTAYPSGSVIELTEPELRLCAHQVEPVTEAIAKKKAGKKPPSTEPD